MKSMAEDVWGDLTKNYPICNTPTKLLEALNNSLKGEWSNYGYYCPYSTEIKGNVLCVHTDKSGPGGGSCGGHYYIYSLDKTKCVEDF